jgi:Tol biopolymer transport system component
MQDTSRRKTNPSFSPDGQTIAFGIWRPGVTPNIWLMDADGKNPRQVTTEQSGGALANWISDNDQLGYITTHDDRQVLASLSLSTGRQQTLADLGQDFYFHRLSPDGRTVASHSRSGGAFNVWTRSLHGGEFKQLTFDKEGIGFPSWSPDGKYLALEIKRGDDTHIGIMPSNGGEVTQLTFEHGQSWPHSWSPDGQKIAFAGFRNGYWNVWSVSIKDKVEKQLTEFSKSNAYVRYPAWSPRGDRIVFEYAESTGNIWVMDLK